MWTSYRFFVVLSSTFNAFIDEVERGAKGRCLEDLQSTTRLVPPHVSNTAPHATPSYVSLTLYLLRHVLIHTCISEGTLPGASTRRTPGG